MGPGLPPGPPPSFAPMGFVQMATFDPFALTGPARFRAPPPPAAHERASTLRDYNEVKAKGALTGSTRTPEQTDIANFWTDNPGIIMMAARYAAIACKRVPNTRQPGTALRARQPRGRPTRSSPSGTASCYYNLWRPMTAIREGDNDGEPGDGSAIRTGSRSSTRRTIRTTRRVPTACSGAVTKTLELFFGRDNISFDAHEQLRRLPSRSRAPTRSFSAASQQVVNVRIWQGIHFRFADVEARKQGRAVAKYVLRPLPAAALELSLRGDSGPRIERCGAFSFAAAIMGG